LTLALKLQVKATARLRIWLKASGQRDVDDVGQLAYGGLLALGGRVGF
jgi:hypothetical protein